MDQYQQKQNITKIRINNISKEVFSFRGFDERGCYGCKCNDACCRYGADIDRETYNLILENRQEIEKTIGLPLEKCFDYKWQSDNEFLGGDAMRSTILQKGFCSFHMPEGRGCVLFKIAKEKGISIRLVPSICRVFPLTWDKGEIRLYKLIDMEPTCNTFEKSNNTSKSIFESVKHAIDDIFHLEI